MKSKLRFNLYTEFTGNFTRNEKCKYKYTPKDNAFTIFTMSKKRKRGTDIETDPELLAEVFEPEARKRKRSKIAEEAVTELLEELPDIPEESVQRKKLKKLAKRSKKPRKKTIKSKLTASLRTRVKTLKSKLREAQRDLRSLSCRRKKTTQ